MKTLAKAVVIERNHVAMVMKERNLLARLHCPQLVNMHYAFQDGGARDVGAPAFRFSALYSSVSLSAAKNLYIVMDLCLGGDLHYQLSQQAERSFSEDQARFYAASVVLCLEYMHGAGILHRCVQLLGRGSLSLFTSRTARILYLLQRY